MKKPAFLMIAGLVLIALIGIFVFSRNNSSKPPVIVQEEKVDLPVNTIPIEERPFITLTPDKTGRNLEAAIANAPKEGELKYEILYNAGEAQEGGLGSLLLSSAQPLKKSILLGTRSAGGATTYHEGVTGGSLTVTYNDLRLKEQFNFLRFDPADPTVSSSDLRFSAALPAKPMKKDTVVVVMKTFGLPAPVTGKLVAGPYGYFAPEPVKGSVEVSFRLPAGEYTNAGVVSYVNGKWVEFKTTKKGEDTLVATTTTGNVFAVTDN